MMPVKCTNLSFVTINISQVIKKCTFFDRKKNIVMFLFYSNIHPPANNQLIILTEICQYVIAHKKTERKKIETNIVMQRLFGASFHF